MSIVGFVLLTMLLAAVVSFAITPLVKAFSVKVGAIDVPKDNRRMHDHPIPRLGGLAIFLGFMFAVVLMVPLNGSERGMLLGAVIIVVLGIFDDIYALPAKLKFVVQIVAALISVLAGNQISILSNPNIFSENPIWVLDDWLSIALSVIWVVAITNAVNLIDGLDGLACGVSTISSAAMLIIALLVKLDVAMIMGALVGACIGFLPYNFNPAKIFMGDTGATFLGFIMANMSIQGMFKMYTIISFVAPFLILGLPIFDVCFAVVRRLSKGQSPMRPDRSHIHHRLIDMGLSQKQAVGMLYVISAILGLSAVVLTTSGALRALIFLAAAGLAALLAWRVLIVGHTGSYAQHRKPMEDEEEEQHGPSER
ncbi:MAG TPA: undecaprenyl/decaprenyl-phosphate alpha-N-acetylglucosaminyl 1-phosphate transferase [Candidatus Enterenecus stercoripullorum]|nr:undecaprenyl/decaprenyl-phosphate alpha-N-acetylglucosaminyl 1-phosphate transferase [Candidatus Enterenecus stercoripullorum]